MPVRAVPNVHRLTLAMLAVLAVPAMAQQAGTTETDASGKIKNLDQVTVTGSRIKRADADTIDGNGGTAMRCAGYPINVRQAPAPGRKHR